MHWRDEHKSYFSDKAPVSRFRLCIIIKSRNPKVSGTAGRAVKQQNFDFVNMQRIECWKERKNGVM